jgi:hypothetical protein
MGKQVSKKINRATVEQQIRRVVLEKRQRTAQLLDKIIERRRMRKFVSILLELRVRLVNGPVPIDALLDMHKKSRLPAPMGPTESNSHKEFQQSENGF